MKSPQVAAIVADTLSGYLVMGQKRMVCHLVPPEHVKPGMFHVSKRAKERAKQKPLPQTKNLGKMKQITTRLIQRERKKRQALEKLGIDYDFPGVSGKTTKKKKRKDSVGSVDSAKSGGSRKRKDSIASVDSAKSGGSRKRKDSIASVESTSSASKKRKQVEVSTPKTEKVVKEAATTQQKKKKKSKKDKKRRNSS